MRRPSSVRSLVARALLGVMVLGSACHFWHHLADPSCGMDVRHSAQPCATCAGLHGSATAIEQTDDAAPNPVALASISFVEAARPIALVIPGGAPRAPPIV
jgi:hypothetical protein